MASKNYRIGILLSLQDRMSDRLARMDSQARKVENTTKRLNRTTVSPTVRLNDRISVPLKMIEGKLKNLGRTVLRIGGAGLAALGIGTGHGLKLAGDMEQANIAFETMLGSVQKAKKFLADLTTFAVKTPFEMPQLMDASRKLLAFGFASEKVIPMLTAVGNAASGLGLGEDGMQRIIIALGQMKAKAKISGEEMLQLTEAGVPAWDILAQAMGKSTAEVMKLSQKGLIPADEAIDALVKGMSDKFPDMMMKQSKSLFGLISTLKDFANLKFFWAFGEGLRQAAVPALQKFVDMLDKNEAGTKRVQDRLMEMGRAIGAFVVDKFEKLYRWFEKLSSDETFQKMSFGERIIYVVNQGLDALGAWLDGPGSEKVSSMAAKVAGIAMQAWWATLKGSFTGGVKSLGKGDLDAAAGQLLFANLLSGGLLAMGGGALLKKGGGKLIGKIGNKLGTPSVAKSTTAKKAAVKSVTRGRGAQIPDETAQLLDRYSRAGGARSKITKSQELLARYQQVTGGIDSGKVTPLAGKSSPAPNKLMARYAAVMGKGGMSRAIGATKVLGKVAVPLAVAGEIAEVATSKNKARAATSGAAGLAGMAGGAKVGALIGTAIAPGIGTAVGGVLGGAIGYFGGKKLAGAAYDSATAQKKAAGTSEDAGKRVNSAALKVVDSQEQLRKSFDQLGMSVDTASAKLGGIGGTGGSGSNVVPFPSLNGKTDSRLLQNPFYYQTHAMGGIFNHPHLGLVAEAGPEAIIPLSPGQRNRGLGIWAQTGRQLGVAGGDLCVSANVTLVSQTNEDELALSIGRKILAAVKQQLENQAS